MNANAFTEHIQTVSIAIFIIIFVHALIALRRLASASWDFNPNLRQGLSTYATKSVQSEEQGKISMGA
eukprot:SAG11_NODE_2083_length_3848_cov_1.703121_2_plen_68_part_00